MNNVLQVLKELEWSGRVREDFGHHDYSYVRACPICGVTLVKIVGKKYKEHRENCALHSAIEQVKE